ncbi:MAG: PatB family C-S lyase [Phycisphaerales bacterium]
MKGPSGMNDTFDFDRIVDRHNTDSLKWDKYEGKDVIPMWVADMDFQAPRPILDALHARVEHGVFGYGVPPEELVRVVVDRMARQYGWTIQPSWIVWMPGVVSAINVVCRACGDEVLTFAPIYPPFLSAPPSARQSVKTIPLAREAGRYVMDCDRFEREIGDRSRLFLLCNPHNPVGRRFDRSELHRITEICLAHDVTICSDEIHCDLVLDGPHTPTASLSPEISARTITLMAPSMTFNIPGLSCSFAIIENAELRAKFNKAQHGIVPGVNVLGYTACLAAFRDCEPWRRALIEYLRGNEQIVHKMVNEEMPGLSMDHVEATYLAWIDTRPLNLPHPGRFFEHAGVGLSDGKHFEGEGFVRLNFGCPRSTLLAGLERMKRAVTRGGSEI